MILRYFKDTDTLYIELKEAEVIETQNLGEDTILDIDENGNIVSITVEHASHRTDVHNLSISGIAA